MQADTGVATVQFERQNQPLNSIANFLHLDLMPNNKVRIDDDTDTEFGTFPRGKPFIVQVTLDIDESPSAHRTVRGGCFRNSGPRDPAAKSSDGAAVRRSQGGDGVPASRNAAGHQYRGITQDRLIRSARRAPSSSC